MINSSVTCLECKPYFNWRAVRTAQQVKSYSYSNHNNRARLVAEGRPAVLAWTCQSLPKIFLKTLKNPPFFLSLSSLFFLSVEPLSAVFALTG